MKVIDIKKADIWALRTDTVLYFPDESGGGENSVYGLYQHALAPMAGDGVASVGLPLIGAEAVGYTPERVWREALNACGDFLDQNHISLEIVFAVSTDGELAQGKQILLEEASRYKIAERSDFRRLTIPENLSSFVLEAKFTEKQMKHLRKGKIPQEMEDKWLWFMEGDSLFAFRSWTGRLAYRVDFSRDGRHTVFIDCAPEERDAKLIDDARDLLCRLLSRWSGECW